MFVSNFQGKYIHISMKNASFFNIDLEKIQTALYLYADSKNNYSILLRKAHRTE